MGGVRWTEEHIKLLTEHYPKMDMEELCKLLNRDISALYHKAGKLGLKRLENPGRNNLLIYGVASRFKKGSVPFNKGTKGLTTANKSSFKKGHVPHNMRNHGKPYMTSRVRDNGRVENIWFIGLGDGVRVPYIRFLWESTHGKLDKNIIVTFVDGVVLDRVPVIEDLKIITRAENAIRNSGAEHLTDNFVKGTLKRQGIPNPEPGLIKLKKQYLKVTRKIGKHEKDNGSNSN